jgi:hypothetical protein
LSDSRAENTTQLAASAVSNSAEFDRMQERKNHEKAFGGCTVCIGACGRHRTCAGRCPDRAASTGSGALWPAPASRLGVARRLPTLGWATLRLGSGLLGPAAAAARGVGSCALGPAAPRMGFCSGTLAVLNRAQNDRGLRGRRPLLCPLLINPKQIIAAGFRSPARSLLPPAE